MKKTLLFIVILWISAGIFCQAQQMRYYGSAELSCSLIKRMVQDSRGFIWIATENGLNKFDGWTFTHYFHDGKDSTSLQNNYLESLLSDSKGRLWVASRKGVQCYSPEEDTFKTVSFLDGNKPSVLNLCELHTGEIWAVTAGYGVYSINPETMEATSLIWVNDLCSSPYMHNIYEDHLHRIWIALPGGRMVRLLPESQTTDFDGLPGASPIKVYTIREDSEKHLWVATATDVYRWDEPAHGFIGIERKEYIDIRGMICTEKGDIYVNTTNAGVQYVDRIKGELVKYNHPAIPQNDNIMAMIEDRKGNLWLACYKSGISMLSNEPSLFTFVDVPSISASKKVPACIYEDKEKDVWVSMSDGMLTGLDRNMQKKRSYALGRDIISMFEDSNGTFWLGSYGALSRFNKETGDVERLPEFQGKTVHNLVEGPDKKLYLSVTGEGFTCYDLRTGASEQICDTTRLNTPMRLGNNWINAMCCDSEGLIWLAHCMGVNCYDPARRQFLKLESCSVVFGNLCYALLEDKQGHIWIGTHEGLFEYDKKSDTLRHYGTEEGMPNNVICGLGEAENGDVWCSTYNGLCKLSYPDRTAINYFSGNGLVDKEYLRSVFYQRKGNAMYVGSIHGVTRFFPDSVGRQSALNEPQLTHVYLDNKEVSPHTRLAGRYIADDVWMDTRQINLTYKNDIFAFEFSTMEFHESQNIRFEYRLAELGSAWRSTIPGNNRITYNYLPPGHYTFQVYVCENELRSPLRSFSIYIAPPWYATVWARAGYVLLLLGVLFGAFRVWNLRQRQRRQEELNEEKLKFFINIAHELRSPVTLILSPLQALMKQEQDEGKKKALHTMQRNANRIMDLINQLLDIRKIDKGQMRIACRETDLVGFVEELFRMFDYQAVKRNIRFSFVHSMESLPVWIDRNNFDKVLMNLIVNAFKYTPDDGEITVVLAVGEDTNMRGPLSRYAEITLLDSGTGLDEKKLEKIFDRFYQASANSRGFGIGLNLVKMLVELHHGSVSAANRTDRQGSCFTVRIPLGKEHLRAEELSEELPSPVSEPLHLALTEENYLEEDNKTQTLKSKTQWRVLVVDDDDEMREYLQQELGGYYKVAAACNGVEAYRIALQQKIDLIISDVVMPDMNGFELLKKARGNANISHIPFILLTSQAEYDNRLKGWNVGADAFLAKPFRIEELLLMCDNLITNRVRLKGHYEMAPEVEEKMKPIEVKANDDLFLERLMKAINENLQDSKFGVEDLAGAIGVSRVQLHRKLKTLTGTTTSEFIRNIRLKQAAKLLKEKKVNVSQIAYLVGFTNPTLFSIAFKKFYGCTPSEYMDRESGK